MGWDKSNPINFASDGDTTGEAIEKFINEFTSVYTLLNRLRKIDRGGTAPSDPDTDAIWLDTSGAYPVLKYYNGASWVDGLPNASTLEGHAASYFQTASGYTAADVLAKLLTVDGAGSGLDADTLDGTQGSLFALLASPAFTGTPTAPTAANGTNTTQVATTAFAYGTASKAASGYQKLPSGIILQWGSTTGTSVTFPIAFPNALFQIVQGNYRPTADFGDTIYIKSQSTTGFTCGSYSGQTLTYLAIGY